MRNSSQAWGTCKVSCSPLTWHEPQPFQLSMPIWVSLTPQGVMYSVLSFGLSTYLSRLSAGQMSFTGSQTSLQHPEAWPVSV